MFAPPLKQKLGFLKWVESGVESIPPVPEDLRANPCPPPVCPQGLRDPQPSSSHPQHLVWIQLGTHPPNAIASVAILLAFLWAPLQCLFPFHDHALYSLSLPPSLWRAAQLQDLWSRSHTLAIGLPCLGLFLAGVDALSLGIAPPGYL